ncbi:EscU/YscU/HrcU family type III secretion system export apparatus switch protein [Alloalcanivorax profundimaris]|uniref:EscU/YscU/HrcU family type III secretion system export apparatus switch protein n=1 Tax=Alloalcanivorax profundimaris TaxID=2735259 RepID=UPI001888CA41|nr:EscU/YscU/HrcU family type III secretion system export apparatus switch protein [Alloalcanivorax profundimaris]MBF1800828.1 flagellar protein FhlB [Alloalcanivorax profundimaris]MCQ6261732.1 EscU/YscU/HrcU family type III secretion system export apparatus switch protein [Alcanivorax sp. MM125-6]
MTDQRPDAPRRRAVALAYREGGDAPRVLARGYGELAERIIAEARRRDIFVHDAPELVALLMRLDVDERIPSTLYQVIAELLVWVRDLDEREGERNRG